MNRLGLGVTLDGSAEVALAAAGVGMRAGEGVVVGVAVEVRGVARRWAHWTAGCDHRCMVLVTIVGVLLVEGLG